MKAELKNVIEKFLKGKKQNYFFVIGIVGIILIAASDLNFADKEYSSDDTDYLQSYKIQLENELTQLLKEVEGVGEVSVMLTLESGEENVYVQQQKSTSDIDITDEEGKTRESSQSSYENEVVIVSEQNSTYPLVERTIQPVVQGVAVVCGGADDIKVVSAVTNIVSVVLNVPTNRIYVTKMR